MKTTELNNNLLNLNDKGVAMFVPFIKQIVCEDLDKYNAIDGYQAAILSMNLNPYIKLSHKDKKEVNPADLNFLESFDIIIKDQQEMLTQAYKEFSVLINKYLSSDDPTIDINKFRESMFRK